jgi:hypothetical protein
MFVKLRAEVGRTHGRLPLDNKERTELEESNNHPPIKTTCYKQYLRQNRLLQVIDPK